MIKALAWLACSPLVLAAAGCGAEADDTTRATFPEYAHPLSEGESACGRADFKELFPFSIRSATLPVLVHYYREEERDTARQVLAFVEKGWDYHVNRIGMRPPLTDAGECGPDDAFDVLVWRGHRSCLVDVLGDEPSTSWNDGHPFMIVDPWGPYGGADLEETVVHEMAHASQAADDWNESPVLFEMSASFLDQIYMDRYADEGLADFQRHPDRAIDHDDDYETWAMYGSSMVLLYLKDRFFDGDPTFVSRMWLDARNPKGAEGALDRNEPDFVDALDAMLREVADTSYVGVVPELARWRWYTGDHIDDRHFRHFAGGLENLEEARLTLAAQIEASPGRIDIRDGAPMMLGTSYIELSAGAHAARPVCVSLDAPEDARRRFVVQAVPGLTPDSDGELLDLSSGPAPLELAADGKRTLVVTALPTGPYDPDTRGEQRYPFTVVLHPGSGSCSG
ncbi:hypothetical protein BE21_41365 [Sorangium cellulosum]|uniref:Secreted protein n=1 Tax=Sorangium cellulosum TaxID=56 RepID=A0A150TL75_SORCE|nr:hypothetical protein BE21_41365 [Sorangium cellulosum]